MTDFEKLEILAAATSGDVAHLSDKIAEYGTAEVRKILFWDLNVFFPLDQNIRAVFALFNQTETLIKALEIRENPELVKGKDVLSRLIAETDFIDDHETNAYFRILTDAAIEADAKEAIKALIEERQKRGL